MHDMIGWVFHITSEDMSATWDITAMVQSELWRERARAKAKNKFRSSPLWQRQLRGTKPQADDDDGNDGNPGNG